jgi:1-acyl-sn-glycerol-3-phosphate acyltransferase
MRRRRCELDVWWRFGLAVVGAVFRACFRVRVTGIERVPERGAAILAGNHVSGLDGVVVALVVGRFRGRMTRFLAAAEFFERFPVSWGLRIYRQIPLRRGSSDVRALDEAIRTIRSGALAGIFPEGRVNPDPEAGLQRGRRGLARIALASGAPVIPVGIWGTQRRWPRSGLHLHPPLRTVVAIAFGDPVPARGDVASADDVRRFTDLVMAHIAEQTAKARSLAEPWKPV